jgi:hypothetical protein
MAKEVIVGALTRVILGAEAITPPLSVVLDWVELFHWKLYNGGQGGERGGIKIRHHYSILIHHL